MIATPTASATHSRPRRETALPLASAFRGRGARLALLLVAEASLFALLAVAFSIPEPLALGARLLLSF